MNFIYLFLPYLIFGNIYLRRWKLFWLEILIIIILLISYYLIFLSEIGIIDSKIFSNTLDLVSKSRMIDENTEQFSKDSIILLSIPILLIILIFRINCIIAIINTRKLIRNS